MSELVGSPHRSSPHGEIHDLSVAVAEQLSRDLDAAIEMLRSDQSEDADDGDADYDPDDEFVEVLTSVEGIGPTVAKRLEQQFDSLEAVVDASDEELESVESAGRKTRVLIREFEI
ncbi:helix-hairpin-helix domain-containing protein [Haloparvum sp. AD34]